jgi:hypothetical protein
MNPLQAELRRLYLVSPAVQNDRNAQLADCVAADGSVRALVLELARPADWDALARVWQGVQADLNLPAPAIAVNGVDGYQLWFSVVQAVSAADALAFLDALRARYLGTIARARIDLMPPFASLVPAVQPSTLLWSAFIAPDLAAVFADEPWLDLPPNPQAQAQVLAGLESIKPLAWQAAVDSLKPAAAVASGVAAGAALAPSAVLDPKQFLMDVVADTRVDLQLRIDAAKALLPYL